MKPFHFLSALCPSPALPCYTNYPDPKQLNPVPLCAHSERPLLCSRCSVKGTKKAVLKPLSPSFLRRSLRRQPFLSEQAPLSPGSPSDRIPRVRGGLLPPRVLFGSLCRLCYSAGMLDTLQMHPRATAAGEESRWLHRQRSARLCAPGVRPTPPSAPHTPAMPALTRQHPEDPWSGRLQSFSGCCADSVLWTCPLGWLAGLDGLRGHPPLIARRGDPALA